MSGPVYMSETRSGTVADPEARYANFFRIGFNAYEFVLDFGQEYPPEAERIHTRLVVNIALARNLCETLESSLRDYSSRFPQGANDRVKR